MIGKNLFLKKKKEEKTKLIFLSLWKKIDPILIDKKLIDLFSVNFCFMNVPCFLFYSYFWTQVCYLVYTYRCVNVFVKKGTKLSILSYDIGVIMEQISNQMSLFSSLYLEI